MSLYVMKYKSHPSRSEGGSSPTSKTPGLMKESTLPKYIYLEFNFAGSLWVYHTLNIEFSSMFSENVRKYGF